MEKMEKEYIQTIEGRQLRAVFTLAVAQEIESKIGFSKLKSFGKKGQVVDWKLVARVFQIMFRHGEALEGREFSLTCDELKRFLPMDQVYALISIITRETKSFNAKDLKPISIN